jgi:hypothetical protein
MKSETARLLDVLLPMVRERVRAPQIPRRSVPHWELFSSFVAAVRGEVAEPLVTPESVVPTLELLDALRSSG